MELLLLFALVGLSAARRPYIIGGDTVKDAGKYPWQGSLRWYGSHNCGVSLIGPTWGLTAGHCVEGTGENVLSVQFGSNNRKQGGVVARVQKIIMHEYYDKGSGYLPNDIAVLKFDRSVSGANIASIDMPATGSDHVGNGDCWITGWGYTETGNGNKNLPDDLQEAKVKVYKNSVCKNDWGNDITPGMVCVGDKTEGIGSCNGDSGGPLVCKVNGEYELVGVTSWGVPDCGPDYYSVYTRVASYRSWVKEKTDI